MLLKSQPLCPYPKSTRNARGGILREQQAAISGEITNLKVKMHNKNTFEWTLSAQNKITARWRGNNAIRFSHDARNKDAENRLKDLDSQIHVTDEAWSRFEPIVQDEAKFLTAVSQTNRDVGFRTHPADFTAWLDNLHANLTRN